MPFSLHDSCVLLHGELSCPMQRPRALLHFFSIPCILVKLISFAIICIIGSVLSYFALWLVENGQGNNCEGHGGHVMTGLVISVLVHVFLCCQVEVLHLSLSDLPTL